MRGAVIAGLWLMACGELDPGVGPPRAGRCVDRDSDPEQSLSFIADIRPIIDGDPGCGCHLPTEPDPIGFIATGLDLSSLERLLEGGVTSGADIVVPGLPCQSVLYQKTTAAPPFGSQMPFDGPPMLPERDRQRIADWIAQGAPP